MSTHLVAAGQVALLVGPGQDASVGPVRALPGPHDHPTSTDGI